MDSIRRKGTLVVTLKNPALWNTPLSDKSFAVLPSIFFFLFADFWGALPVDNLRFTILLVENSEYEVIALL